MEENEMINYEKKYNEALERAQKATRAGGDVAMENVQYIFPELRESEDEKIRKWIASYIHHGVFTEDEHPMALKAVEWLEKQKEPVVNKEGMYYYLGGEFIYCGYPATKENPYDFAMSQQEKQKESLHISETCKENADSFTDEDERIRKEIIEYLQRYLPTDELLKEQEMVAWLEKQKEQRPAEWNEEDEKMLDSVIRIIAQFDGLAHEPTYAGPKWTHPYIKELDWLKSLHPSWKPGEEQMKVLYGILVGCRGTWGKDTVTTMESLYQDLKKLM